MIFVLLQVQKRVAALYLCLSISSHMIQVDSHICAIGKEIDNLNEWKWVLTYQDLCKCTGVIMGGINTWTPLRPFVPRYYDSLLLSYDVIKIRDYYRIRGCGYDSRVSSTVQSVSDPISTARGALTTAHTSSTRTASVGFSTTDVVNEFLTTTGQASTTTSPGSIVYADKVSSTTDTLASTTTDLSSAVTTSEASATTGIVNELLMTTEEASTTLATSSSGLTVTANVSSSTTDVVNEFLTTSEEASSITSSVSTVTASEASSTTAVVDNPWDKPGSENLLTTAEEALTTAASSLTTTAKCITPLGLENGAIADAQITVSSRGDHCGGTGRLNGYMWCGRHSDEDKWIYVNLQKTITVGGIMIQGAGNNIPYEWVETCLVQYMDENERKIFISDSLGYHKVFNSNTDANSTVTILFDQSIDAIAIIVKPKKCTTGNCSMRLEILGC